MSSRNPKHTHKYYKAKMGFGTVWACALPNCSHYMPPHMADILPGKNTVCWKCGERTVLDARTMAMDKPLCLDCDPNAITPNLDVQTIAELLGRATVTDKDGDE